MDFSSLKRTDSFEKLKQQMEDTTTRKDNDELFWVPTVDKAGNGMAIIRFLPAPPQDGEEGLPWVKLWRHSFQGDNLMWLIEECLTTIGKECPVCESNRKLWETGVESNKEIARKRKRKLNYVANILVINDPANTDNNGKVFLFKFGKKIYEKLEEAMKPQFPDEVPLNPVDFWNGANFKLKMRNVDGYRSYDKSEFEKPSALLEGDDDKLEELWKQEHSLLQFVDENNFKSAQQIEVRLAKVLGLYRPPVDLHSEDSVSDGPTYGGDQSPEVDTSSTTTDEDYDFFKEFADQQGSKETPF